MRKVMISAAAAFLFMSATPVLAENNPQSETKDVQLTSQQKQELSVLYKEMLEKKKEILSKYVEYGVLSKTESQKISSHMENRYQHMEQNGFIPKRHCHKTHHPK
ncbi:MULTISPECIES: YckD family protein [Priestia]|uniref:YckD family protein n=1 Tax=Priestia TaxID=2800373 RepID=UPI00203C7F8C|nr:MULTISPECIES: YckD family protein [Priestia]MCM3771309.1 YckD family protein [Priestia aryabhattai]MDY0941747.1 YckD family protein [Priestia megaterium]